MQVRYSKKRACFVAADPDYPKVRGYGQSEDEAVEDLADKIEDYEGDLFEAELGWPEDPENAHRPGWRVDEDPFFGDDDE